VETYNVFSGDEARNIFGEVREEVYSPSFGNRLERAENDAQFRLDFYDEVKTALKEKEIYVLNAPVAIFENRPIEARQRCSDLRKDPITPKEAAKIFCDCEEIKNASKVFLYVVTEMSVSKPDPAGEEMTLIDFNTFLPYQGKGRTDKCIKFRFAVL
jgi:hypothetical protein